MRDMRSLDKPKAMLPGNEDLTVNHPLRRTQCKIIYADKGANHAARGLSVGRDLQPFIKRATLIRLEMTEGNPTYLRWIHDGSDCLAHCRKQRFHARMKQ